MSPVIDYRTLPRQYALTVEIKLTELPNQFSEPEEPIVRRSGKAVESNGGQVYQTAERNWSVCISWTASRLRFSQSRNGDGFQFRRTRENYRTV